MTNTVSSLSILLTYSLQTSPFSFWYSTSQLGPTKIVHERGIEWSSCKEENNSQYLAVVDFNAPRVLHYSAFINFKVAKIHTCL